MPVRSQGISQHSQVYEGQPHMSTSQGMDQTKTRSDTRASLGSIYMTDPSRHWGIPPIFFRSFRRVGDQPCAYHVGIGTYPLLAFRLLSPVEIWDLRAFGPFESHLYFSFRTYVPLDRSSLTFISVSGPTCQWTSVPHYHSISGPTCLWTYVFPYHFHPQRVHYHSCPRRTLHPQRAHSIHP